MKMGIYGLNIQFIFYWRKTSDVSQIPPPNRQMMKNRVTHRRRPLPRGNSRDAVVEGAEGGEEVSSGVEEVAQAKVRLHLGAPVGIRVPHTVRRKPDALLQHVRGLGLQTLKGQDVAEVQVGDCRKETVMTRLHQ